MTQYHLNMPYVFVDLWFCFRGSAIALATSYYCVLFMFIGYIWISGVYKETWDGNLFFMTQSLLTLIRNEICMDRLSPYNQIPPRMCLNHKELIAT